MPVPLAADYPFMDVLWSMLIFVGFIMWFWLVIMVFADIFRRHDIGGFVKALWCIVVIFLPLFGVLVYLIAYNKGIAERTGKEVAAQQEAFDARVREVAGSGGAASEIQSAKALLDSGAITQAEFDQIKARALGAA